MERHDETCDELEFTRLQLLYNLSAKMLSASSWCFAMSHANGALATLKTRNRFIYNAQPTYDLK